MNLSSHFTTAFSQAVAWPRIAAILFAACALSAHAETIDAPEASDCAEVFQLQTSRVQPHGGADAYGQWWFEPHVANDEIRRSLPLTPADAERFLGAKNDSVLIRWRAAAHDASTQGASQLTNMAQRESYLLLRAGESIRDMDGATLGRFVRLIAKARWDARLSVAPLGDNATREFTAPLRIVQAVEEVDRTDRVVPRMCVQLAAPQSVAPAALNAPTTQARLLGFLSASNARLIGVHNSIAIMDQGAEHGVTLEQRWVLVEMIDAAQKNTQNHAQVTRQRAQVRILQVLPRYSLIQIQNAEREVVRGAYLKRLTPTAVDAP